ncbi:MAG: hypothetical protein AVDCRST_MAG86-3962 [uncultured Truepera sp.]|uniref:Uncharacterized protein n=1 Tax=uncultured Truepera sp. TaxID=543023 RepID=A0A6J4VYI7_9DEIN|nr:MAG: hypothetical protein AVDCRST_MAG86-3962 [uncultured Truepera sp.]
MVESVWKEDVTIRFSHGHFPSCARSSGKVGCGMSGFHHKELTGQFCCVGLYNVIEVKLE